MRKRVYIAGPISRGDLAENIRRAESAFFALARAGFAPFCPQWSVYSTGPREAFGGFVWARAEASGGGLQHHQWIAVDLPWVEAAHAVLRLPGESEGADIEVSHAHKFGIPVYHSLAELIAKEINSNSTGAECPRL